jgi:hypothetical protein
MAIKAKEGLDDSVEYSVTHRDVYFLQTARNADRALRYLYPVRSFFGAKFIHAEPALKPSD